VSHSVSGVAACLTDRGEITDSQIYSSRGLASQIPSDPLEREAGCSIRDRFHQILMVESTWVTLSVLASMRAFPTVGQITSDSDREIQEPSNNRSIQGESSREEGDFIGTDLIRFGGVLLVHASDSSSDNRSSAACNSKPTHVTDRACMPMI
jgi:hypothetical protein